MNRFEFVLDSWLINFFKDYGNWLTDSKHTVYGKQYRKFQDSEYFPQSKNLINSFIDNSVYLWEEESTKAEIRWFYTHICMLFKGKTILCYKSVMGRVETGFTAYDLSDMIYRTPSNFKKLEKSYYNIMHFLKNNNMEEIQNG